MYGAPVKMKAPKKQGQKSREDERLAMEVKGNKDKIKRLKGSRVNPWTKHVASTRKKMKGATLKAVLVAASKTYKKK